MSTLKKEFRQVQKQVVIDLMQKYEKQWFYGNDSYYYYHLDKFTFLQCDGNKIINKRRYNSSVDDILSFEYMEESEFRDELDVILAKAYLTGVYRSRYRMFRGSYRVNIMEN